MVTGEKAQLKSCGSPMHESEMGLLNDPDCACAVILNFADFPAGMVMESGAAPNDRDGAGWLEAHVGL